MKERAAKFCVYDDQIKCKSAHLSYTPVSYTHLDVYKRQELCFPKLFVEEYDNIDNHYVDNHEIRYSIVNELVPDFCVV